jgi:hypothetical protein
LQFLAQAVLVLSTSEAQQALLLLVKVVLDYNIFNFHQNPVYSGFFYG